MFSLGDKSRSPAPRRSRLRKSTACCGSRRLRSSASHEDVIHSIANREVGGRPARCIEFDTAAGEKTESNELCVDSAHGTLLSEKLGNDFIENGDFFPFAGALFPGTISYSEAGVLKTQVTQTMTALTDATPNVLAAPPDAQIRKACTTYGAPLAFPCRSQNQAMAAGTQISWCGE
jgi:hypothetical protein